MIKILIVSTIGIRMYGITNSIMNYYREMDKSDMQIDFLSPREMPNNIKDEIINNGGVVYEKITRNYRVLKYMKQLRKIISTGQYDIIHAHGNSNTLAIEMVVAKLCGVKVRIAHCHSSTSDHKLLQMLLKPLFVSSYTHAFACSIKAGKWLYGERPFSVIHNAIPVEKYFYNQQVRKEYRMKLNYENNIVIGHVGHFSYHKNHELLIKVFEELYHKDNSYRLLLIGNGDLEEKIKDQIINSHLEEVVCLYGETFEVSKILQAMDIFVFPSMFEGLGIAVIEAQSAGLPCVVSSEVPYEAKTTKLMEFVSLNAPISTWVNKIRKNSYIDRESTFEHSRKLILKSNYNIKNEVGKLRNHYFKYVMESNCPWRDDGENQKK